jgi:hypothetical protein
MHEFITAGKEQALYMAFLKVTCDSVVQYIIDVMYVCTWGCTLVCVVLCCLVTCTVMFCTNDVHSEIKIQDKNIELILKV